MANKEGAIIHTGMIRLRVVGDGDLKMTLLGFNDIYTKDLMDVPMNSTEAKERQRLTNFASQATRLKIYTSAKDEVFQINSITIFIREQYKEYPNVD